MKPWDFVTEFIATLVDKLMADDVDWGDTWLRRPVKGQDQRMVDSLKIYIEKFENGAELDIMSIIGGCFIVWVRRTHPEFWKE